MASLSSQNVCNNISNSTYSPRILLLSHQEVESISQPLEPGQKFVTVSANRTEQMTSIRGNTF